MDDKFSGFLIAAAQSGSGKTTVTLGLLRALRNAGLKVQSFKCGPDYIDTGFHEIAAGEKSINLDTWMMEEQGVLSAWSRHCQNCDVAIVEGVMGLFDGRKPGKLEGSSADVSRLLSLPVLLVVDAKGMSGSIAPLVAGYTNFNTEVTIAGVIANNVGSANHAALLKESLTLAGLPPLVGHLLRDDSFAFPSRHLGLIPFLESSGDEQRIENVADAVECTINLELLLECTQMERPKAQNIKPRAVKGKRVAVAYDEAFHFYYEENLAKLRASGCEVVRFSPLRDTTLPEADWVYLGGGFPEIYAEQLAENVAMREAIKEYAESGGTIFAECGGYLYLGNEVLVEGNSYPMCGVINAVATLHEKRQALGYRTMDLLDNLPFAVKGEILRGHEFHYTSMELQRSYDPLFRVTNSRGAVSEAGISYKNVRASYLHLSL